MTLTGVPLFWQNLKSDVIKTVKRHSNKKDKDPEETEKIKNTRKITKTPIKIWSTTVYISGNMIKLRFADRVEDMISPAEWVDRYTSYCSYKGTMVLMSGRSSKEHGRKMVMVKAPKPYSVQSLPDMPTAVELAGIVKTENHIYVIGGYSIDKDTTQKFSNVNRLCLQSNQWEECPEIQPNVVDPMTVVGHGYIYVIGSTWFGMYSRKVQRFNIETSEWSTIKKLPHVARQCNASAKFFKGRLTIATTKKLMQYDQDTDEWIVKTFKDLKRRPLLSVREGQLCASVPLPLWSKKFTKKVYDEEENIWLDNE